LSTFLKFFSVVENKKAEEEMSCLVNT